MNAFLLYRIEYLSLSVSTIRKKRAQKLEEAYSYEYVYCSSKIGKAFFLSTVQIPSSCCTLKYSALDWKDGHCVSFTKEIGKTYIFTIFSFFFLSTQEGQ